MNLSIVIFVLTVLTVLLIYLGNTMKVKYYLAFPDAIEKSMILLSCSWNGFRLRMSIGISVNPKVWDSDKRRVKKSSTESTSLNAKLDQIESFIINEYNKSNLNNDIFNDKELKKIIFDFLNPTKKLKKIGKKLSLIDIYTNFINERTGKKIKKVTSKGYKTTLNHLKKFKEITKYDLTFENINNDFYDKFNDYLVVNCKLQNSSVGNHFKNIKSLMNDSFDKKLHSNLDFKKFEVKKIDSDLVALTWEELELLENYIPINPKLKKVKDHFLLLCYTGLRYSDLQQVRPENINLKEGYIKVTTIKTSDSIKTSLNDNAIEILKAYPDLKLRVMSNQKFNDYLKELCQLAEINEEIQKTEFSGLNRIDKKFFKYEMITSHCGRRSFITLGLKLGILPEMLMEQTGHKKRDTFQKYVKISQTESVNATNNAWNKRK